MSNKRRGGELPDTTDDAVRPAEVDNGVTILDDTESNMFIQYWDPDEGRYKTDNKTKNARNELLYVHGMYDLIQGNGDGIVQLTEEPYRAITRGPDERTYLIWYEQGEGVITSPSQELKVLRAVRDLMDDEDEEDDVTSRTPFKDLYEYIVDNQVRRSLVSRMLEYPPLNMTDSIEVVGDGWLFSGQLLLTWECDLHNRNGIDGGYTVGGSGTKRVGSQNQSFDLTIGYNEIERKEIGFPDGTVEFGKQEMMFLIKATWIIDNLKLQGAAADSHEVDHEG